MNEPLLLLTSICIAIAFLGIWIYNRLVKDRNLVANGWSDIDVQLVRRHDLVPQLVNAVAGYANYEQATLEAVTQLRTQSLDAQNLASKAAIEDVIADSVGKLVAVAEDYPDLKADQNFRQLSEALTEIENHLQYARRFYNGAVRIFNTRIMSFPHLLVAKPLGFKVAQYFSAPEEARITPQFTLE